jgi:hypothetical protein
MNVKFVLLYYLLWKGLVNMHRKPFHIVSCNILYIKLVEVLTLLFLKI